MLNKKNLKKKFLHDVEKLDLNILLYPCTKIMVYTERGCSLRAAMPLKILWVITPKIIDGFELSFWYIVCTLYTELFDLT